MVIERWSAFGYDTLVALSIPPYLTPMPLLPHPALTSYPRSEIAGDRGGGNVLPSGVPVVG